MPVLIFTILVFLAIFDLQSKDQGSHRIMASVNNCLNDVKKTVKHRDYELDT